MLHLDTLVNHHARFRGDRPAITFERETLTWSEFASHVNRTAQALSQLGIGHGDKVATMLGNCRELMELTWAAPSIGAANVPLSPMLMAPGLLSLLTDSHAACLITQVSLLPVIESIRTELPEALAQRILLTDGEAPGYLDLRELKSQACDEPVSANVTQDDLFNIMYTSGTTGLPKGIMHSHFVRAMYAILFGGAFRMTPESVVLHTGALTFNGAYVTLMPSFWHGGHFIFTRQFDACETIELIERYAVTHIVMVPTQIVQILDAPNFDPARLASLQMLQSVGAPLHREHKDRLNRLLPGRFYEIYGLTEGFVTILDVTQSTRKAGSVGVPPAFYAMRIVREDGDDADVGEVGEIVGRGPIQMTGYYGQPELTAQTIRDGWLYTGDLGFVDDEGYLHLVDRKKDMIDSGGVKVYPKDIEEVAAHHPSIREVAVFGIPHEKWGETPVAAVVLHRPGDASEEELREWINARVAARYQRVERVLLMDELPRNAAGKTLKRELRAPYWEHVGRSI